jgi:hypothetical protein
LKAAIFSVCPAFASVRAQAHGLDPSAPLNPPEEGVRPEIVSRPKEASTNAFQVAALVSAALMLLGAAINGIGIKNPSREALEAATEGDPGGEA